MEPAFLGLTELVEIHQDQINRYGGEPGIRDLALLQSALGAPMATFQGAYLHSDLFEMAAAYLFHLTKNHPFVDGNKRTGAAAALVFLLINGHELDVRPDRLADLVLEVAGGAVAKSEVAVFLRKHSRPA